MKEIIKPEGLDEALHLLKYILYIRMYGERAPGGNENWCDADLRLDKFFREYVTYEKRN